MKTKDGQPKRVGTQRQAEQAGPGTWKVKSSIGMYLIVSETGARSGVFRYSRLENPKKIREMGLGPLGDLDALKDLAKAAHILRRGGKDPIEERERANKARAEAEAAAIAAAKIKPVTFAEMVHTFIDRHAPTWRRADARKVWLAPLRLYVMPAIGALPIKDVRIAHVVAAMERAEQSVAAKDANKRRSRDGKESARRVRQHIAQVIDMATALGEFDLANPAAPGPISKIKPLRQRGERAHFRRIADLNGAPKEFQILMAAFDRNPSSPLAAYIVMTACGFRPGETRQLQWANIDFNRSLVDLEPEQTKSFRRHVAPLSDLAMRAINHQLKIKRSKYVFPAIRSGRDGLDSTRRPMSENALSDAPKHAGLNLSTTAHAWRAVFRSWCKVIGRVPYELAEEALAHATVAVVAAYDRDPAIEARREIMARYATWLTGVEPSDNVVPFAQKAA